MTLNETPRHEHARLIQPHAIQKVAWDRGIWNARTPSIGCSRATSPYPGQTNLGRLFERLQLNFMLPNGETKSFP